MRRPRRAVRRDAGRARGAPVVEAVLARTLEELAAAGVAGLSVERVARRAQVNKTSVYRRWRTREALIAAALERVLDEVGAGAPDTGSLRGDLLGLLRPVAQLAGRPAGRALLRAALSEPAGPEVARLAARRLAQRTGDPVRALVARARRRGEWRAGAGAAQVLSALVGAVLHRVLLEHAPAGRRWLESLVDVALLGVLPRPAPGERRPAG